MSSKVRGHIHLLWLLEVVRNTIHLHDRARNRRRMRPVFLESHNRLLHKQLVLAMPSCSHYYSRHATDTCLNKLASLVKVLLLCVINGKICKHYP
jgi:hypothetical protein